MIELKDIKIEYSASFALNIDSLVIEDGDRVALVGANGSGKSTLLRLISGYTKPDSGIIQAVGKCLESPAYMPQNPYVFSGSVRKNIGIGMADSDRFEKEKTIARVLEAVGLKALADKKAVNMSGGEKQRMVLGRMLSAPHGLLLLDEPLSAVDIDFKASLEALIADYCGKNGTTLLMATHTPVEAVKLCDKIIIMNKGAIAELGSTSDIMANPKTPFGEAFLKQWRITDA